MLVLSRKRGERIMIGGGIEVTVMEVRRDKVQLGIEAPVEVTIRRKEVMQRTRVESRGEQCESTA